MTWSASPADKVVNVDDPVDGDARIRRPSVSTVANPPTVIAAGVPRAPRLSDFHAETLPWTSVARTRNAYVRPLTPGYIALCMVVWASQVTHVPPLTDAWTSN